MYCANHRRRMALLAASTLAAGVSSVVAQPVPCCQPWDNGGYDGSGAQTSQTGYDQEWRHFGRVTFDDFWLCESSVYRARHLRGVICTDALIPKAKVLIVRDCEGRPDLSETGIIGYADSVPVDTTDLPLGAECRLGSVTITETGNVNADGFRILDVEASFPKLWLEGGAYWVAIIGYSGNANPLDQFFWGFAGNGVVKGRPGVFYNSDDGSISDVDQLCCGCTDFAFCFEADDCKVLLDNGGPDLSHYAPSFANPGSTFRESRAADDVVISACEDRRVCFVEGYLLTNCNPPRARLDIYDNACKLPATFAPPATFQSQCIYDTGIGLATPGGPLNLYRVQFWDLQAIDGSPFVLQQGKNYWFSIYGVGTGSQTQRAFFVGAERCDLNCGGRTSHFNQAAVSGFGVGRTDASWIPVSQYSGSPFDLSLLVATDEVLPEMFRNPIVAGPTCAADVDHSGSVSLQDLFAFLAAWFAGCP
jgi:hypothetical protein